jgi:type IV pilus assembly protein PilM
MKLTFAKAEHLKCNATKSPDPRAVFQALRPVFNDYVSEIQRSIGYFSSVNRNAKIGRLVGVGNGFKLAGLQKFLQQNLQYEVDRVDNFRGVVGDHVLTAPLFQDNLLTFVVPYGLALQALKLTDIHTTLLPKEIAVARKIRRKKPWAVATAASLLIGTAVSTAGYANVWHSVSESRFGKAEEESKNLGQEISTLQNNYNGAVGANTGAKAKGSQLVAMLPTRELWLELYKAIDECLPRDEGKDEDETDLQKLNRISLDSITFKKEGDLSAWFNGLPQTQRDLSMDKEELATPPTGEGYVVTLHGHHYHHEEKNPRTGWGNTYTNHVFVSNLRKHVLERKNPFNPSQVTRVDVKRQGISHSLITYNPQSIDVPYWPNGKPGVRNMSGMSGASVPFGASALSGETMPLNRFGSGGFPSSASPLPARLTQDDTSAKPTLVKKTQFVIEFAWKPTPPDKRVDPPSEAPADGAVAPVGTAPVVDPGATPDAATQPVPMPNAAPAPNGASTPTPANPQ